jgi:hypothetical protein
MPRPDYSKMTPEQIAADKAAREARRAEHRKAAHADKVERAKAGGHDPAQYGGDDWTIEKLESLAHELQTKESPKAQRLAVRVALDRKLNLKYAMARAAGLSDEDRSVIVEAETLRVKGAPKR